MKRESRSEEFAAKGLKWGAIIGAIGFAAFVLAFPPSIVAAPGVLVALSTSQLITLSVVWGILGGIFGGAASAITGGIVGFFFPKKDKNSPEPQPQQLPPQKVGRSSQPPSQEPQMAQGQGTDLDNAQSASPNFRDRVTAPQPANAQPQR